MTACARSEPFATGITHSEEGFVVDAEIVARNLGLSPDNFWREMKRGAIRSKAERGEGEDAGHMRLTFRYRGRSWSVTLDGVAPTT